MPIYDYKCPDCDNVVRNVFVHVTKIDSYKQKCKCGHKKMVKLVSRFIAKVFPSEGLYLEHVSSTGKTFYSEKEMRQYERDNDVELGALL